MTRKIGVILLAGVAALAAGGTAMAAAAQSHILKVVLPDGSVERIRYTGEVAPRVVLVPARAMPTALFDPFEDGSSLQFDRVIAEMNRQTADMMQQLAAMQARPTGANGQVDLAALQNMPIGTVHYSFVSTSNGRSICSQSVEVTSQGPNLKPKMVSQSSGDCAGAPAAVQPALGHDAAAAAPATLPVKAEARTPAAHTGPTI